MGGSHHHDHSHSHDHQHGHDSKTYDHLLNRIDANAVSLPKTPLVKKALSVLFSQEEAKLASKMPGEFANAAKVSKLAGIPLEKTKKMLENMADRGLLFDLYRYSEPHYLLLPAIPGFIEFSLATENPAIPQKEMAAIWKQIRENEHHALFTSLFGINQETQFGRIISYEDTLKQNAEHEVCSYDRVSEVIEEARAVGVVYCHCRHERKLNGEEVCSHPLEVCITLGITADVFSRHNIGRKLDKAAARELLAQTEEMGLVHMLDNVQSKPAFMCNCCSCACDMVRSFYEVSPFNTVMTSNFIAQVQVDKCTACGRCARACPIGAITLKKNLSPKVVLYPEIEESICFGCGVCAKACKEEALYLVARKQRLITPETAFHRMALTALERGKFQDFLLANPSNLTQKGAKVMIKSFLNFPLTKKILLQKEVNSRFLNVLFEAAKKSDMGWAMEWL